MFDSLSDNSAEKLYIQENFGKWLEPLKGDTGLSKLTSRYKIFQFKYSFIKKWSISCQTISGFRYICFYLPSNRSIKYRI
jgi:hypothetical protein